MSEWRNWHIYYTELDRFIRSCLAPVLDRYSTGLETYFFERHYAGGAHLRVRVRGTSQVLDQFSPGLVREVENYIASYPSLPVTNYSERGSVKLLAMEEDDAEGSDLTYHVNEILSRPYGRLEHRLASNEAAALLEQFLHDAIPLCMAVLNSNRPKLDEGLRLCLLEALLVSGSLSAGCLSFKSHWEGLATFYCSEQLVTRILARYAEQRLRIFHLIAEVKTHYENETICEDQVLDLWRALINQYSARVKAILRAGTPITVQPKSTDEVRAMRASIGENAIDKNPFLRVLWGDERFLASFQCEENLLYPRVLTNLLYNLLSLIGLRFIDKTALCYYAQRGVEEYCNCDLTSMMARTVGHFVNKHRDRV